MSTFSYLKNLLRDKNIGSVTPSSFFGVRKICDRIDFSQKILIIEYVPGTGVFRKYLLSRMTKDSQLLLIENNRSFVSELKKINDERIKIYNGMVQDLTVSLLS